MQIINFYVTLYDLFLILSILTTLCGITVLCTFIFDYKKVDRHLLDVENKDNFNDKL